MMMKRNLFLGACLCAGAMLLSCEKNDGEGAGTGEGKAQMVAVVDMAPQANNGYILPIQDISVENASFQNAYEVKSSNHAVKYKDWVFVVEGMSGGYIRKYIRNDDGTLSEGGSLLVGKTSPTVSHALVVSDTKGYASAMMDNKIIIFNPSTMQQTGEIDIADARWGVDGKETPNPMGLFLRDDLLFVGLGEFTTPPTGAKGAHILLIDAKTDIPIKKITDNRLTCATAIGAGGMFVDEKNDLYIPCWGSYGFDPTHYSGLLRIKSGETEFDPDYCFNLSTMTFDGVQGGKLQYVMTYHYTGNGEVYFFGYCPAFASPTPDFINDKTNYSFKGDLYNCTAEVLNLPRSNAYSCAINHVGDQVLFGLATESNGVGLFAYNRNTRTCSPAPVINVQGTVMNLQVFE